MTNLTPLAQKFISHFGEMGSRWGINRTVGQIYALLYVLAKPLNADDIAGHLGFSRSNVSMGLKELQAWRLVKLLHQPGDRREYFEPPKDIWDIFKALLEERRRREIEPTLSMLRDALLETPDNEVDRVAQRRMREMYDLIELSSSWFDDVQRLSPETLASLMKMGATVGKLLDVGGTVRSKLGLGRSGAGTTPAVKAADLAGLGDLGELDDLSDLSDLSDMSGLSDLSDLNADQDPS
ncbi:GbsR/MarR family transcriptional regulator [Rugamonas sp.]|uniref:GbsR/MarR family transcriptional regulator n=1 Tax=Rugamonas sp. TaxID=1926287 RepID=UPI0025F02DA3|nr:GbsR/MarR family transcriptional regulator [Rugamonas sp.]